MRYKNKWSYGGIWVESYIVFFFFFSLYQEALWPSTQRCFFVFQLLHTKLNKMLKILKQQQQLKRPMKGMYKGKFFILKRIVCLFAKIF